MDTDFIVHLSASGNCHNRLYWLIWLLAVARETKDKLYSRQRYKSFANMKAHEREIKKTKQKNLIKLNEKKEERQTRNSNEIRLQTAIGGADEVKQ